MKRNLILLTSLFLLGATLSTATANTDSIRLQRSEVFSRAYTKSINKLFQVNQAGDLRIENRHGDIKYAVWDRNEVKINVLIEVDASSESRAEETFKRISVDFSDGPTSVAAKTEIGTNGSSSWWGSSNCSFSINYTISAPKGWDVHFTNSYGDIRMPDLAKDAKLDVRYGDLFAGDIAGSTDLYVAYGEAHLGKLQKLDATFKYAEVEIKTATLTTINSKYSETTIKRIGRLQLDSQYDEFTIGSVKEFVNAGRYDDFRIDSAWSVQLESRYTDIKINYLADDVDLDMRFGDAKVGGTSPSLSKMIMKGEYTDFSVRLNPAVKYSLEAKGRYTDFDLPSSLKMVRKEEIGSSSNFIGSFGANPKAKIVLTTSHGSIDIR